MVKTSRRSFVVLCVLLAAGCSGAPPPGGGDGGTQNPKTGPVTTSFTLDTANAATATLDATGGTVTATGSDGTTYTLTVPAGALYASTDITVTPLTGVKIDGAGAAWEVGAKLEPEGILFLTPVTLTVKTSAAASSKASVTLVDSSTSLFVPQASGTTGTSFTAKLHHFSTYVIAPYTASLVSRAADALLASLASPPTRLDVEGLATLWKRAEDLALTSTATKLATALHKAVADFDNAQLNLTAPTANDALGALLLGGMVTSAGSASDGTSVDNTATSLYGAVTQALQTKLLQAHVFADYVALVPPISEAVAIAKAYPAVLQGGNVINPETLATTLIGDLQSFADRDCNKAHYSTGAQELNQVMQAIPSLGLTSPTVQDVQADAATCVPPSVTGVEFPSQVLWTEAAYTPNTGQTGTDSTDSEPASAMTIAATNSASASSSATDSSATVSVDVSVDPSSGTVTFNAAGQADATVSTTGESVFANSSIGQSGSGGAFYIDVANTRGPSTLTVSWTGGTPTTSGLASASLAGSVEGVTLWPSGNATGSTTISLVGGGYTPGGPAPTARLLVQLNLATSVSHASGSQTGSASISGSVTVKVAPNPQ